jgi:hypothetical protein
MPRQARAEAAGARSPALSISALMPSLLAFAHALALDVDGGTGGERISGLGAVVAVD